MKIPLVDLKAQYESIKPEIDATIRRIIETSQFIMGAPVENFERNWARYCKAKHAIGCSNGTTAIELALKGAQIGNSDEVLVTPNTFIATTESITHAGAQIKFVDVEEKTMNIDPEKVESAITSKTKAIIAVHLYGQMCDMKRLKEIADRHNLILIEDAAQAHGAEFEGHTIGYYSHAATFSFFPSKILGCMGDGGAVTTNDDAIAERIRLLVNHGRTDKYLHIIEGHNYRLDSLQAAILDAKLPHLDQWIRRRREIATIYDLKLKQTIKIPSQLKDRTHTYYMYVIRTDRRDMLAKHLSDKGIACSVHYPLPLHFQPAYKRLKHKEGDFPVAEKLCKEVLSIPMYPELTDGQINSVAEAITEFFDKKMTPPKN
jgi:dTDP-4-amino-4,6-dideoxygalactose transaminase